MVEWSHIARRIRVPLGFLFAVLYFGLARPTGRSMALGAILIGLGLLIRALASGHVRKNELLATSGPYGTRSAVLRSAASVTTHARRTAPDQGLLAIGSAAVVGAANELLAGDLRS